MDACHRSELVRRVIARYTRAFAWNQDRLLERHDLFPEVEDEISSLIVENPDVCFDILLDVARANGSKEVLGPLGAKFSVLLETQPNRFVRRLEDAVPADRALRELLTWTNPDDPKTQPWVRIKELVSEVPW